MVGHGRLRHIFMTQGVTALLAAVGKDTDNLKPQRVAESEKDIFEANLFTFGVIGDHNIPVSAAAQLREQQPVSAAGRNIPKLLF